MKPLNSYPTDLLRCLAAGVLLAGLGSCHFEGDFDLESFAERSYHDPDGPVVLATSVVEGGTTATYSVSGQTRRFPADLDELTGAVLTSVQETVELPFLGLNVASVNTADALELGIEAWEGVLVSKVEPQSAAAAAGLKRGDLLLDLDGTALASEDQFADLVRATVLPGDELTVSVSRSTGEFAREDMVLQLTAGSRTVEETVADRTELRLDPELVGRAGLGIMTVPADLAGEIYGEDRPVALVSAVVTGSPAYLAGFRAGDRILEANGFPVSSAEEMRQQMERNDEDLALYVDGVLGLHEASFELEEDVLETSDFEIPIIVDYSKRASRKRLGVLDFIFQFGFNKNRTYYTSSTRRPRKSTYLSILPLGMFEFTRTPEKVRNRIFWLISWSSKR